MGTTMITLPSGITFNLADATNHSLRLEWYEQESANPYRYDQRLVHVEDTRGPSVFYDVRTGKDYHQLYIELLKGWEFLVTEVRCSNPWGAFVVEYPPAKPLTTICGEHTQLIRPWVFRQHLQAHFEYRAANRHIWASKDGAPRRAMIVLSGALIEVRT